MFHKLSFTELANLYGAVADLEKHYGHETVHEALKEMADRLDQSEKNVVQIEANTIAKMWSPMMLAELKRPTLLDVFPPGETIKIKDEESGINTEATVGPKSTEQQLELLPKPRKPHKVRQTQERVRAEKIAKELIYNSLDELLADQYFNKKYFQSDIADLLLVNQTTVSNWIRNIPEKVIKKIVGSK